MQKKYLIIGTSAAGLSAAHKLRQLDSAGSITCITKEKELSYNKCLLADFIGSGIDYPTFKTEKFFTDNRIDVVTDCEIVSIDRVKKIVISSLAQEYSYDALLLATGGDLVRPEFQTQDCENVFDFYTYDQTHAFKIYAQRESTQTILIIGGGLSGLECADVLQKYNKNLIIIEKVDRILAHQITPQASQFLEDRIRKLGIECITETVVKDFVIHNKTVTHVILSNGQERAVDMVVYALGAQANLELPRKAGLEVLREGIVVNEYMQASDAAIWAAGDNCRVWNIFTQTYAKNCTWPEAMQQGMYAAHSMAGVIKPYKGTMPVISSAFFGVKFYVAGTIYPRNDEDVVSIDTGDEYYTMTITCNNKVQGFIIFGDNSQFFDLKRSLVTQSIYNYRE